MDKAWRPSNFEDWAVPRQEMDVDLEAELQYKSALNADIRRDLYRYADPPLDIWKEMAEALPLQGDETIIDVGSGSGHFLELLLQRGHSGRMLGVDKYASQFFDALRRIKLSDPNGLVAFQQGDAQNLKQFPDNLFDVGVSNFMWYHIADAPAAARELKRVVKPNGLILVSSRGEENMTKLWEHAHMAAGDIGAVQYSSFYSRCNIERTHGIVSAEFELVDQGLQDSPLKIPFPAYGQESPSIEQIEGWRRYQRAFITLIDSMIDSTTGQPLSSQQIWKFIEHADGIMLSTLSLEAETHLEKEGEGYIVDRVKQGYFIARNTK
jgi:SAM-dependent methyltransferase